jgi:hypothetical protein
MSLSSQADISLIGLPSACARMFTAVGFADATIGTRNSAARLRSTTRNSSCRVTKASLPSSLSTTRL